MSGNTYVASQVFAFLEDSLVTIEFSSEFFDKLFEELLVVLASIEPEPEI